MIPFFSLALPHILLISATTLYITGGAWAFQIIEIPHEVRRRNYHLNEILKAQVNEKLKKI